MLYYTMPRAVTNYAGATPPWSHRRRVVDSSRNCTVLLWEKKPPDTCVRVLCARSVLLYSTVIVLLDVTYPKYFVLTYHQWG